jgi:hypothetical protein
MTCAPAVAQSHHAGVLPPSTLLTVRHWVVWCLGLTPWEYIILNECGKFCNSPMSHVRLLHGGFMAPAANTYNLRSCANCPSHSCCCCCQRVN